MISAVLPPRGTTSISKRELTLFLKARGIEYPFWNSGTSRSLGELVKTLKYEKVFLEEQGGEKPPLLTVNCAVAKVRTIRNERCLEIFEDKQYFHKTRQEISRQDFDGIAETMKRGEKPIETVRRALREELGQTQPRFCRPNLLKIPDEFKIDIQYQPSQKWPGLQGKYIRHIFMIYVDSRFYKNVYFERIYDDNHELTRTICFRWKPV